MILSSFLIWLCISKIRTAAAVVFILVLAGGESLAARNYLAYWKDSVTLFTYMVDATPNATSPRNVLAVLFAQKGDINRAVEHLNEVLKLKPDDVDAHLDIGKILADQHRYDEAMVHYNRVLDMGRNQADIYSNIALVLADEGRFDEAVNMYRRGLELKVRNPYMLHSGLGVLLMRQGKMDEAITELQIAAEQRPDPATLNNLAGVLILKGRLSEAIECYINAIKLDLNNAKAYCKLANILFSQGNIESAIGGYERALDINPKYIEAHLNLALALARLGRLQQAGDEYRQVLQLEPNNAAAIQGLKNIQAKQ
jgi:tetratricopeptide (TPR) repeat protein